MNEFPKLRRGDVVKVADTNAKTFYVGIVVEQVEDLVTVQIITKNKQSLEITIMDVERASCSQDISFKGSKKEDALS